MLMKALNFSWKNLKTNKKNNNKKSSTKKPSQEFFLRFKLRSIANSSCVVRVMCQLSQTRIWQLTAVGRVTSGRQQERSFFILSGGKKGTENIFFFWTVVQSAQNEKTLGQQQQQHPFLSMQALPNCVRWSAALNKCGFFSRWTIQFFKLWNRLFFFFSVLKTLRYMG